MNQDQNALDCTQRLPRLSVWLDDELAETERAALDAHLQNCAACGTAFAAQRELRAQIRAHAPRYAAPEHLAARILDGLPKPAAPEPAAPAPTRRNRSGWNAWNLGAIFASLAAMVVSVSLYLAVPSAQQQLADEVLASHVRALQVDHLSDVASSDRHTVKPWFNGKLDFAPTVVDYTSQGFPLVGGRLDYLDRQNVAVLVYRHRLHSINLFIWPSGAPDRAPRELGERGYHLVHWIEHGMNYWAVSDLASNELGAFVRLVRTSG
jgi:anti-sigma factor RsiW